MIEAREKLWPQECPEAIAEGRVRFEPIDFFAQSPIAGADIYYVRRLVSDKRTIADMAMLGSTVEEYPVSIFFSTSTLFIFIMHARHDWEDELAIKILINVRNAMAPHSRILIRENDNLTAPLSPDLTDASIYSPQTSTFCRTSPASRTSGTSSQRRRSPSCPTTASGACGRITWTSA